MPREYVSVYPTSEGTKYDFGINKWFKSLFKNRKKLNQIAAKFAENMSEQLSKNDLEHKVDKLEIELKKLKDRIFPLD